MAGAVEEIVRIEKVNLPGKKPAVVALTQLDGVSYSVSNAILRAAGIKEVNQRLGALSDKKIEQIKKVVSNLKKNLPPWLLNRRKDYETGEDLHLIGSDRKMAEREDIKRMQEIKSYKGLRHAWGLKVRGQRTKSTGRTGIAVGVKRKEVRIREAKARRRKGKKG